jgi:serine protease inhibitor
MMRYFKKLRLKLYLRFKKITRTDMPLIDKNEVKSSAICRKLISRSDSTFLIAPLSHRRYIKNDALGMFIVLSDSRINITNHVYNYDVNLTQTVSDKLNRLFDGKVELLRLSFESEIKRQIKHSLTTILEKLT